MRCRIVLPLILSRGPLPSGYLGSHRYMISGHCKESNDLERAGIELPHQKRHIGYEHNNALRLDDLLNVSAGVAEDLHRAIKSFGIEDLHNGKHNTCRELWSFA